MIANKYVNKINQLAGRGLVDQDIDTKLRLFLCSYLAFWLIIVYYYTNICKYK